MLQYGVYNLQSKRKRRIKHEIKNMYYICIKKDAVSIIVHQDWPYSDRGGENPCILVSCPMLIVKF